ncbi:MAG: hypothetical protein AABX16_00710 [Nanoarchaeota archaeon]
MNNITKKSIIYNEPSEISWDIPGVLYRGEKGTYQLFGEMSPSLNQDQLAELYTKEKQKGNPHPTDMPLMWAIATRAHELRSDDKNEKLKNFLKQSLRRWPNTLTRIIYNLSEDDCVIHNYGTSDKYSVNCTVVGSDRWINKLLDKNILENILGTQDTQKINEISQYVNGTDTYLWRLNSKPNQKDERVAGFYADDCRLIFDCDWRPLGGCPAFRVLRVE